MLLKIASRKSDLARLQAYIVAKEFKKIDSLIEVKHLFSASFGDMNPDISLDQMPTKGAFTEDFVEGIKSGEFDLVVHSWKDLPTDLPSTSQIFTIKREDPRDVLIVRKDSIGKIKDKKIINILTSSPRRIHHIKPFVKEFFPFKIDHVHCPEVRGNIPTRLRKLIEKDGDALIMAKAALDRLLSVKLSEFDSVKKEIRVYLNQCQFMILPLSHFPTAAAQGALALEVNTSNTKVIDLLKKIHCHETFTNVKRERELLRSYGGGCHQKLGMTSVTHRNGYYFSVSGVTPKNETIKSVELINKTNKTESVKDGSLFKAPPFFEREIIKVDIPVSDLYIAKDFALPEDFKQVDQVLFTSGTSSWSKLAKRGYWISGTSESLGEDWGRNIQNLYSKDIKWLKLSHLDAPGEKLATYKLIPLNDIPDLSQTKYFYWNSGSQFELALKRNPDIISAQHACGPGSTQSTILKSVPMEHLEIYLSYDQWYKNKVG